MGITTLTKARRTKQKAGLQRAGHPARSGFQSRGAAGEDRGPSQEPAAETEGFRLHRSGVQDRLLPLRPHRRAADGAVPGLQGRRDPGAGVLGGVWAGRGPAPGPVRDPQQHAAVVNGVLPASRPWRPRPPDQLPVCASGGPPGRPLLLPNVLLDPPGARCAGDRQGGGSSSGGLLRRRCGRGQSCGEAAGCAAGGLPRKSGSWAAVVPQMGEVEPKERSPDPHASGEYGPGCGIPHGDHPREYGLPVLPVQPPRTLREGLPGGFSFPTTRRSRFLYSQLLRRSGASFGRGFPSGLEQLAPP
eukprot:RCo051824